MVQQQIKENLKSMQNEMVSFFQFLCIARTGMSFMTWLRPQIDSRKPPVIKKCPFPPKTDRNEVFKSGNGQLDSFLWHFKNKNVLIEAIHKSKAEVIREKELEAQAEARRAKNTVRKEKRLAVKNAKMGIEVETPAPAATPAEPTAAKKSKK